MIDETTDIFFFVSDVAERTIPFGNMKWNKPKYNKVKFK